MKTSKLFFWILSLFIFLLPSLSAQDSHGAQIFTKENFLFGRFEVVMQSAEGAGIVSSFFLYNLEAGIKCRWPEENNEIDVEMTGNNQQIYFTTHHPDPVHPWFISQDFNMGFNPHRGLHKYTIEWEPGIVRWFVDDDLVYIQNEAAIQNLKYPMAIMMNLWASDIEVWVGKWNPAVMPRQSMYEYVSYAAYTPGRGSVGTNRNFSPVWKDEFTTLNEDRWVVSDFDPISPLTVFRKPNVEVDGGQLKLHLTEPTVTIERIPVTFSVDMSDAGLRQTDVVYLNGTFNNWCGNCHPMKRNGDVWNLTLDLSPGKHEYLFTINVWEKVGGAPLNSACDFQPCDEFPNYGFRLHEGSPELALTTYCWETCNDCMITGTFDPVGGERTLLGTFDILGRPVVDPEIGQLIISIYSDGSIIKRVKLE